MNFSKKRLLSKTFHYSGIIYFLSRINRLRGQSFPIILAYHDIAITSSLDSPFSKGAVSATVAGFEQQVRYLSSNFDVITFYELRDRLNNGRSLKNTAIITFDDGYKNNYLLAYPILKKYRVPAVIFLSTNHVDSDKVFWFEELNYLINSSLKKTFVLYIGGVKRDFSLENKKKREESKVKLLTLCKSASHQLRVEIIEQIHKVLECAVPSREAKKLNLSWAEIEEMAEDGNIEFGSHTLSHPVLSKLKLTELQQELMVSKKIIEGRLKKEVISFSYPFGDPETFGPREVAEVQRCGYSFATTYTHDFNTYYTIKQNPYLLKRIHVEKDVCYSQFLLSFFLRGV